MEDLKQYDPSQFTILMVDDTPKNLQVLGTTLSNEKYNLEFATNGLQALKWIETKKFDIVLLDIMMPEMDGFETCKKIRENSELNDMPIIFLTAQTDKESIVKGFEIGGQDYVTKPFDSKELLARVKTHLELKQSKESLKKVNVYLEEKVKERTIELKEANIELEQLNNELINLDKEKLEFLGIISHEIRTPLNGIMGFLDIIKSRINNEELLVFIDHVDKSSIRLNEFALQALLITELKTGQRKLIKQDILIKDLINSIAQEYLDLISEKHINFNIDLSSENIKFIADADLVTICLRNIIDNAIKFIPEQGNIIVRAFYDENNINIEVIDNGNGFSESAVKNLFKLFSAGQIHTDQNSGLGLALVNLIMQAHNGNVEVLNNKPKGTIVKLQFNIE